MKWLYIPYDKGTYFIPESAIIDVFFEDLETEIALITFHGGGTTKASIPGGAMTYYEALLGNSKVIKFNEKEKS